MVTFPEKSPNVMLGVNPRAVNETVLSIKY